MPPQSNAEIRRRVYGFGVTTVALLAGALLLRGTEGTSGPTFHALVEILGTVLALLAGALALVRYQSRRDDLILLVGAGLLGAALLDGYHALVTTPLVAGAGRLALDAVSPWSWLASRLHLSVFLLLSVLAWRRQEGARGGARVARSTVYGAVAILASTSYLIFATLPLPRALYPELPFHRPQEVVVGFCFLAALILHVRDGGWRHNAFSFWFALALLLGAGVQLLYMPFSATLHDRWYDAAHVLKAASYGAVLTGLMKSVFYTYRLLEESTAELAAANEQLQAEVRVRQAAEAQVLEREERLTDLLDHAHDLIQITGPDGRIQYTNDAWQRTLGYPAAEATGMNILERVDPDRRAAAAAAFQRALGGEDVPDIETVLVSRDGRRVTVVGGINCRFENGRPVATRAIFRDVTEAKRAARDLEIEKTYLERLFEHAPEAIVLMDGDELVTRINAEFTSMFGYTREEALGRSIGELIVPDEARSSATEATHRVSAGETVSFESVRRHKDGRRVEVSVLGTPMQLVDGSRAIYGIYRDVSERRRTRERLRESVERLQALILASPLAIFTLDLEGNVGLWNPAAVAIFGWKEEEVVGGPLPIIPPGEIGSFRDLFGRAMGGEPLYNVEVVRTRNDGRAVHISLSSAPLYRADGALTGIMAMANDVTDRRRAEEALARAKEQAEEANRAKSDFLARMSHELRTPLNSVIGFTKVLLKNRDGNLTETDTTYLSRIAANGEHLLALINDILDLSKVEAGRMELELGPVDVGELVTETVAQLEGRVSGGEVALLADIPPGLAPLEADRHKLKQVLINLVGNALKFTERGQVQVAVRAARGGGRPRAVEVIDTGIGIPADRLGSIFHPFEQAEESTTRRFGGTGLGLSISSRLTEMMGFQLTVRSKLGQGSTFSIVFAPAAQGAEDGATDEAGAGAGGPAPAPTREEGAAGA